MPTPSGRSTDAGGVLTLASSFRETSSSARALVEPPANHPSRRFVRLPILVARGLAQHPANAATSPIFVDRLGALLERPSDLRWPGLLARHPTPLKRHYAAATIPAATGLVSTNVPELQGFVALRLLSSQGPTRPVTPEVAGSSPVAPAQKVAANGDFFDAVPPSVERAGNRPGQPHARALAVSAGPFGRRLYGAPRYELNVAEDVCVIHEPRVR